MPTPLLLALVAVTSLGLFAPSSQAQDSNPQYGIKFDNPPTGSNIRREAVSGSKVPINRTYAQLSQTERELVRNWYEAMPATDEPPFPAEGLKPLLDAIRKVQARLLVSGELFLIASVDSTGTVTEVKAIGSPSPEMVKFAASLLLLTKFKPGYCGGQPCRMEFPMRQVFRVE
jgi:hypothetical protein